MWLIFTLIPLLAVKNLPTGSSLFQISAHCLPMLPSQMWTIVSGTPLFALSKTSLNGWPLKSSILICLGIHVTKLECRTQHLGISLTDVQADMAGKIKISQL